MRIILAFALVAVVAANPPRPEPIHLPQAPEIGQFEEPSMLPLYIPQEIVDAYATGELAELPENFIHPLAYSTFKDVPEPIHFVDNVQEIADAPTKVKIVEQLEVDPSFVANDAVLPEPINWVDNEVDVQEIANALTKVKIAEQPEEIAQSFVHPPAYAGVIPEPINLVDNEVNVQEIADLPALDEAEPVNFAEVEEAATPVRFVEVAEPAFPVDTGVSDLEENFQPQEIPYPGKWYDNAMLR